MCIRDSINHVLYGVNRIHRGLELGATYKLDDHWSFDLAGTISEYYYSNNPCLLYTSLFGRTEQNRVVVFDRGTHRVGDFVNVKITESSSATLKGKEV